MKTLYFIIPMLFILSSIWAIGSYLVVAKLESPKYTVLEKRKGYEIRQYDPYLVAEVIVQGDQSSALNSGFRYLAKYIFGGNTKNESISMTTPVADIESVSEKIAMTVPVSDISSQNNIHTVQFSLPSKYTLETLPKPNSERVKLREVAGFKAAALRYNLWATEKRVESKKALLLDMLERDGEVVNGDLNSAQYNPPASFPLTRRNEIIAPIQ